MEYIVAGISVIVAGYFCVRYLLLKQALRKADRELIDIAQQIEENRVVKLAHPDRDLERLLETINTTLESARHNALDYIKREEELKERIEHISHDLRTPLTSIMGYLSLVEEQELSTQNKQAMETVRRKAGSLQRLITQFYELSRLSGEDYPLKPEISDVGRLLREATASSYTLLSEQGLEVQISIPDHPIQAYLDPAALERVFSNLLHNAGHYARSQLIISMSEDEVGTRISFENDSDSLEGVRAEQLFEPFFTVDAARSQESSGLGLTISRQLVERMGGTMDATIEYDSDIAWLRITIRLERHSR